MQHELAEEIYYFGYAKVDNQSPTSFFEFDRHQPEHLAVYNKFRIDSESCLHEITADGYVAR